MIDGSSPALVSAERALVERFVLSRDERAFRDLYRLHTPRLHRMARRLMGDTGSADDVIQDTWIRAAEGLAAFRWESRLSTWLAGIAVNRCREILRQRRRDSRPQSEATPARGGLEGARIDLQRAVNELAEGYREVLVLHDVYGYTHEQIAAFLGIEVGTSKSQLSRARRAIRERLQGVLVVKGERS